jgi:hypothetical protein
LSPPHPQIDRLKGRIASFEAPETGRQMTPRLQSGDAFARRLHRLASEFNKRCTATEKHY